MLPRVVRLLVPGFARSASLTLLALGTLLVPAAQAGANSSHEGTEYSLSIVEGESTMPEDSILHTSGWVHPGAQVVVSIVRGGVPVARESGHEGVWLSQTPLVGDVVNLESPAGHLVGSVVYDGLPSTDPTVCAGSANFSGQRSSGQTVEGGVFSFTAPDHYGNVHRANLGSAQVTSLVGSAYSGSFLAPAAAGETVWATESLQTPLAGNSTFTYSSENDRPVGACPPPPPAPAPPPPPPALRGEIFKLLRTTIHKLLVSGWLSEVTINQPGTVVEDLYQEEGTLPAFAARVGAKRHALLRRKPPAMLLARGSASAKTPGTVSVVLHATTQGRRKLKHSKHVAAVLITTLHSSSGQTLTLERRTVSLHR
jgi:hypothetical protein